jgi:pilus assembly protein CpaB
MRRTASLTILLIALTFGGFAAFLARSWLQSHSERAATKEEATIVVANKPLVFGTPLSADDVRAVPWPADSKPEGSFANVQELLKDGRRVVLSPFVHDEPIVGTKIGAPNQSASLSTVIEPGKRAVTVAVDDVRGVAGFIFPGDFVDVVLTRATNTNDNAQSFSEEILQHVKVLAIDQMSGDRQERPTVAKAVTLELTPEQALKILLATNIGKLSLILRQSAEVAMAPEMRMTEHDLYGGEPQPPAPPPAPAAVAPAPRPSPDPATRKVTVVRSMKSEEYEVPRDSY